MEPRERMEPSDDTERMRPTNERMRPRNSTINPRNDTERMRPPNERMRPRNDTINPRNDTERRRPSSFAMCMEAAEKLYNYKHFGENITRCECDNYPELCKRLFKNRFLLNEV